MYVCRSVDRSVGLSSFQVSLPMLLSEHLFIFFLVHYFSLFMIFSLYRFYDEKKILVNWPGHTL